MKQNVDKIAIDETNCFKYKEVKMREILKKIVMLEKVVEDAKEESPQYKIFYQGYLKGLREVKSLLLNLIFDK